MPGIGIAAEQNTIMEVIHQPLYCDGVVAAGTLVLPFFQNPVGAGAPALTYLNTNMQLASRAPSPYSFDVKAIQFWVTNTAVLADLALIIETSFLEFNIQEKNYLRVPTCLIGAGAGIKYSSDIAAGVDAVAQNGTEDFKSAFVLDRPITIEAEQNFIVNLNFPAAPAAITAPTRVMVILNGDLKRVVQ